VDNEIVKVFAKEQTLMKDRKEKVLTLITLEPRWLSVPVEERESRAMLERLAVFA
jgi:hypothetical protein